MQIQHFPWLRAADPLLALEEIGYEVPPELQQEFEDRIRFGTEGSGRLKTLRDAVFKHAGGAFDLNSPDELTATLRRLLSKADRHADVKLNSADAEPLLPAILQPRKNDPLEKFRHSHPIMEPLLQYRGIEASTPRFATPDVYTPNPSGAAFVACYQRDRPP